MKCAEFKKMIGLQPPIQSAGLCSLLMITGLPVRHSLTYSVALIAMFAITHCNQLNSDAHWLTISVRSLDARRRSCWSLMRYFMNSFWEETNRSRGLTSNVIVMRDVRKPMLS